MNTVRYLLLLHRSTSALLCAAALLLFCAIPCAAQDTVLRQGDSVLARDVTLADTSKYTQLSIDATDQIWRAFSSSLPESATTFKNALTMLVLVDTMSSGAADPKRYQKALKTVLDFEAGALLSAYESAGYLPLASINTLFTLYNESLIFFRDRIFLPGLANQFYDVYKSHRLNNDPLDHEAAWNLTHIPEPVVADVALNVILKQRGVEPGLYEGLKFDKEHLSKAGRSAEGKAAGRTIRIDAQPGANYSGHPFLISRDISERIEIKAGFVDGYESHMLSIMNMISTRDLDQRGNAATTGYKPLSASDDKAVEREIRSLFERMKTMNMGEKLRNEALEYIGQTYRLRYQQELAGRVLRERAQAAKQALAVEARRLQTYSWVRLVTVKGLGPTGESQPLRDAALFVDGQLCLSDTNGGKPCATNRIGLAALHLLPGGHTIQVRAAGYKPGEIRIVSETPNAPNPAPDEYEIVLTPDAPRDLTVLLRSGAADDSDSPALAGAALTLTLPGGGRLTAQSDTQGRAVFKAVPPGGPYSLRAEAQGHAPGVFDALDFSADPPMFGLEPFRTTVTVQCLGLDGEPLAGVRVRLGDHELDADTQGRAVFENLRPSPEGGYALAGAAQGLPPASGVVLVRPARDGETMLATLSFQVKTGILAVVRDNADKVVPGAVVSVDGPNGRANHATDASGYARIQDLPLGAHYLHAQAPGHQSGPDQEILLTPQSPMGKVRLVLSAGVAIKVLAIGPDKSPASGCTFQMDDEQQMKGLTGSATFPAVLPGIHSFSASCEAGQGRLQFTVLADMGATQTIQIPLTGTGGEVLVQVRDSKGDPLPGAEVILLKNSKPFGMKTGSDVLFDNLTEGYYNAEVKASGYSSASSDSKLVNTVSPRRTLVLRLEPLPDPDAAPAKLALTYATKNRVGENEFQYSGIGLRTPAGDVLQIHVDQATVSAYRAAFCTTVNGVPAKIQIMPAAGYTSGSTYDLSGRLLCDGQNQQGVTCPTFMTITCVVQPECTPGDPKCDPNARSDTDAAQPGLQWSHASSGRDGPYRTFRYVKLNGSIVSATDASAPARFCASQGLAPTTPQPVANAQNWQGILVDATGNVACQTRNAGGDKANCRGYAAISCNEAPEQHPEAPCDPNNPLCGLDTP